MILLLWLEGLRNSQSTRGDLSRDQIRTVFNIAHGQGLVVHHSKGDEPLSVKERVQVPLQWDRIGAAGGW